MQTIQFVRMLWIGYTDFMIKIKSLLDSTNLFSLNEYEKSDKNNKMFLGTKHFYIHRL